MTRVFFKLAFAGLRRRRLEAALTVLVVAASAAALTVALGVDRVADRPWERTFEATRGPHVTAATLAGGPDLTPLASLAGVEAAEGPFPWATTRFAESGRSYGLHFTALPSQALRVGRPVLADGRWPRSGEVAAERSFARFLGIEVGDTLVAANGVRLPVTGIAIAPKAEPYPATQPGQVFGDEETLARVVPARDAWASVLMLRLDDPDATRDFVLRASQAVPGASLSDWHDERAKALEGLRTIQVVLTMFSILLLLAGGFVLATLLGGRVLAQLREIGLLKASGLTPPQVATVFLIEQVVLGLAAALAGLAVGTAATPFFVAQSASLLNASRVPPVDLVSALVVIGVVLAAVAIFTAIPSWRTAGRSVGALLADARGTGLRRSRVGLLRGALPVALGFRDAFLRPGRAILTLLALALTVATVTATLGMEASFALPAQALPAQIEALGPLPDPVDDDASEEATLRPIVYGLDAVLVFVGLVNLVATLALVMRERVRDVGVLKAVGLTPRQISRTFVVSQVVLAAGAVAVGIPLGLGLFRIAVGASGGTDEFAYPAWWWLALLAPATVALVAAITAALARTPARLTVAEALRYE